MKLADNIILFPNSNHETAISEPIVRVFIIGIVYPWESNTCTRLKWAIRKPPQGTQLNKHSKDAHRFNLLSLGWLFCMGGNLLLPFARYVWLIIDGLSDMKVESKLWTISDRANNGRNGCASVGAIVNVVNITFKGTDGSRKGVARHMHRHYGTPGKSQLCRPVWNDGRAIVLNGAEVHRWSKRSEAIRSWTLSKVKSEAMRSGKVSKQIGGYEVRDCK